MFRGKLKQKNESPSYSEFKDLPGEIKVEKPIYRVRCTTFGGAGVKENKGKDHFFYAPFSGKGSKIGLI
jgi:hypothetical protein